MRGVRWPPKLTIVVALIRGTTTLEASRVHVGLDQQPALVQQPSAGESKDVNLVTWEKVLLGYQEVGLASNRLPAMLEWIKQHGMTAAQAPAVVPVPTTTYSRRAGSGVR